MPFSFNKPRTIVKNNHCFSKNGEFFAGSEYFLKWQQNFGILNIFKKLCFLSLIFLRIFNLINKFKKKNKLGREERDRERRIKIEVKHKNKKMGQPLFVVLCETPTKRHEHYLNLWTFFKMGTCVS